MDLSDVLSVCEKFNNFGDAITEQFQALFECETPEEVHGLVESGDLNTHILPDAVKFLQCLISYSSAGDDAGEEADTLVQIIRGYAQHMTCRDSRAVKRALAPYCPTSVRLSRAPGRVPGRITYVVEFVPKTPKAQRENTLQALDDMGALILHEESTALQIRVQFPFLAV